MAYQVVVYRFIVYQNVLRQFGRVVVEKVTECFDYLGDSCSEIGIVLWQLLGEGNEGIERPCLLLSEWKVTRRQARVYSTLKDGM